jgi:hypothetical protein
MLFARADRAWQNRRMKDKPQIVENWLPRYNRACRWNGFGEHMLLTNSAATWDISRD